MYGDKFCDELTFCFFSQASMLSTPDGPFINLARINMSKYAARQNLAKALFEYIFHHENDVRNVSLIFIIQYYCFYFQLLFFLSHFILYIRKFFKSWQ